MPRTAQSMASASTVTAMSRLETAAIVGTGAGLFDLPGGWQNPAAGYTTVYSLEILLLVITIIATFPLLRRLRPAASGALSPG